jgi:Tfp pilus assembly protein PilN
MATVGQKSAQSQQRTAGILTTAGRSRVVILAQGPSPSIVDTADLPASDVSGLRALLTAKGVNRIVRVLPANDAVVRCGDIPMTASGDAATAAALLAEAELPAGLPAFRRAGAAAPVFATRRESESLAPLLMTAWLERNTIPAPILLGEKGEPSSNETWAAPVSTLAALLCRAAGAVQGTAAQGGVFGAITADRTSATVTALRLDGDAPVARVILDDPDDNQSWEEVIRNAELLAGLSEPSGSHTSADTFTTLSGPALSALADSFTRKGVAGPSIDARWLSMYGPALGAALLLSDASLSPLAALSAQPARIKLNALQRTGIWLSNSRRAWTVVAVCGLLILLIPFGAAWVRQNVLTQKASALEEFNKGSKNIELAGAVYTQLEKSRLPMVKLLSDIAACAPIDLVVQNVTLGSDTGLSLTGIAQTREQVTQFETDLKKTKLFKNVNSPSVENRPQGGVEFQMTAKVADPHLKVTWPAEEQILRDFASQPLAIRKAIEGVTMENLPKAEPAKSGSSWSINNLEDENRPRQRDSSSGRSSGSDGAKKTTIESSEPPPALAEDAIAKLDKSTTMREFTQRTKFLRSNAKLESSIKSRLEDEVAKLRARLQTLQSSGGAT